VTLADRAALGESPEDVVSWMARSVNLAEPGEKVTAEQLIERFDPSRLPSEPTTFA
jgi:glutamyl-tRNA synthetase